MTSFSMEYYYPSLVVTRLLYGGAALLSLFFRWLLLSVSRLWSSSSDGDGADAQCHGQEATAASAQAVRESLRVATYAEISDGAGETCAVCLSEVGRRDRVWELRNCRHVFHQGCLDRWLHHDEHLTCPLCRAPLLLPLPPSAAPPPEPSWAVERLLYLFGDDLLFAPPSCS